ncbi:hypothetical protein ACWGS9_28285 [Bradyrhizobium sp. Arg314]
MQQRRLTSPFALALEDQLDSIRMRRWSLKRQDLEDPGLQFAGSVVLEQPVQPDDGGMQGMATPKEVRILDGAQVVACHVRSYDKGAQVEDATHIQALVDEKRAARRHSATDRLAVAVPATTALLQLAAQNGQGTRKLGGARISSSNGPAQWP